MSGVAGQHSNRFIIRTGIHSTFTWYRLSEKHIFVIKKGTNQQIKH